MSGDLKINIFTNKDLQTTLALLQQAPSRIQKALRSYIKEFQNDEWKAQVAAYGTTPLENSVLVDTAKIGFSGLTITLNSGTYGKTSTGTPNSVLAKGAEFGAVRDSVRPAYVAHSKRGKAYNVHNRHTDRQFLGTSRGYAVYPAATKFIPKIASFFVQTIYKTFYESFEGGSK